MECETDHSETARRSLRRVYHGEIWCRLSTVTEVFAASLPLFHDGRRLQHVEEEVVQEPLI